MLAFRMAFMGMFMPLAAAMRVGMAMLVVVIVDVFMLMGVCVRLVSVIVPVFMLMLVRMLVIVAVRVFPLHVSLLLPLA